MPRKLFLHAPSRDAYVATMGEILDETWDDGQVLSEIARMETLIRPYVLSAEETAFADGLSKIRANVTGREAAFRSGLSKLAPTAPDALMEPLCFEKVGTIEASFDTTWTGSGTATLEVSIDGGPLSFVQLSSVAVPKEDDPSGAFIAIFADFADGGRALLLLPVALVDLAPGTLEIPDGIVLFYPPGSDEFNRAEFVTGTVTLEQASEVAGQPVVGSASLDIWNTPFL